MSKKPYIVQEDSPNLVIVPTDETEPRYEPSSKKVRLVSDFPTNQYHNNSAFAKKYSAKSNSNSVNNNVLIDVSKIQKPPTSWATNFLQSIGGSSTKFTKIYSSMPKSPTLRKNFQLENNTETSLPNTIPLQTETKRESNPPIMEEKKAASKISINLIKPKPKPAVQVTLTKEASQPNSKTKSYQSKMDIPANQPHKEPSLPKNYKIPMHSKNKPAIQSVIYKDIRPNIKDTCQKSQPIVSSYKSNSDINQLKRKKRMAHESNKSTHPKMNKDPNQPKHDLIKTIQPETNREKTKDVNQFKTKKIKVRQNNETHVTKPKYYEQIIPPKTNEGTVQPINNEGNSQPKHNKEIKQYKVKETTQPAKSKDPCPPESNKEITSQETNENIAEFINKEAYKVKKKQEPTFSTQLKTKKDHIKVKSNKTSKISKHSESKHIQESKPKKHKDKTLPNEESNLPQALLKKEDSVTKLKKKRTTEKESAGTAEHPNTQNKKLKTNDANTTKKEKSRVINEERLTISPIKSIVSKIQSDVQSHNSDKQYHKESGYFHSQYENKSPTDVDYHCQNSQKPLHGGGPDVDLRTKLKRKITKSEYRKEGYNKRDPSIKKNKFATVAKGNPFVPEENLIISFNTKDDNEENVTMETSPAKRQTRKQPSGGKKRKKIKLQINIVFGQGDTTDEESIESNDDTKDEPLENMDLSFLDDFNVDEIVESLNECKDKHLPVADATVQSSLSNETQKVETTVITPDNAWNKNEIKIETDVCTDISSMANKIENHETASQSTVDKHRPCHRDEVHTGINSGISTIQKEVEIEQETESPQNEKSQETNVCVSSSEVPKINSSAENTIQVHQRTNIPTNIDKPQKDITSKLHIPHSNSKINDVEHSTTSLNNYTEVVKQTPTKNDTVLVTKHEQSEKTEIIVDAKEIKPQIAHLETLVAHSSSTKIIHPDHRNLSDTLLQSNIILEINANKPATASKSNNKAVKKTPNTNEMCTTQRSNTFEKPEVKATGSATIHKINEISTCIKEEYDIITIDDSESENETEIENNQLVKDENTNNIHTSEESALHNSDDVMIIEPTMVENLESILILDTDYTIEGNNDTNTHLKGSETLISAKQNKEMNIDLDNTVKLDNTALEDTTIEIKTNTTAGVNSESEKMSDNQINKGIKAEFEKTEIQHGKDQKGDVSNNAKVANRPNSRTSDESSNKKPTEADNVIPEKCTPKRAIVNTNQQIVNTQFETKAPNNNTPRENCDNDNNDKTTNNEKVNRGLMNSSFVQKAEEKLFDYMGRKFTFTGIFRIGKFSKIYHCRDSFKQEFALKTLKIECVGFRHRLKEQFQKEKMLMKLQNGVPENNLNCVRFIKGFVICGIWCFLMEYYPKNLEQTFAENNRSFHIDDVQMLSRQLVSAVTILRNNNIIHSDIKPSHILINAAQTRIKLCGFDQSCYIQASTLLPNTGTVNYRAPELILGYPAGYGIDVWSTALVMYEMATNSKMFPGIYNNSILYQQLCTLGSIPMDMLMESKYKHVHFRGSAFARIVGRNGKKIIIDEIIFNGKIDSILFQTYESEWGQRGHASRLNDKAKLSAFLELLQSMLVMHPRYRIAIEFVFANPFIYESCDNEY